MGVTGGYKCVRPPERMSLLKGVDEYLKQNLDTIVLVKTIEDDARGTPLSNRRADGDHHIDYWIAPIQSLPRKRMLREDPLLSFANNFLSPYGVKAESLEHYVGVYRFSYEERIGRVEYQSHAKVTLDDDIQHPSSFKDGVIMVGSNSTWAMKRKIWVHVFETEKLARNTSGWMSPAGFD